MPESYVRIGLVRNTALKLTSSIIGSKVSRRLALGPERSTPKALLHPIDVRKEPMYGSRKRSGRASQTGLAKAVVGQRVLDQGIHHRGDERPTWDDRRRRAPAGGEHGLRGREYRRGGHGCHCLERRR